MIDERPQSIIQVLDEATANKIAAGEVVERPASVVKELVENALDAKANEIKVELADGGKKLIRVVDNGIGMSREDAILSLKRHATSKVRTADDLFSIMTLGFRGEALPSISSVSRMEITTRRECDDHGTKVVCIGSEVTEVLDVGCPTGTTISITDLFHNVPARQKFLKSAQTELGHAIELVNRYAVSHSNVDISLSHNDRTIFKSTRSEKTQDAILTVFGRDAAENIIPISGESGPYTVHGFVSRPAYSKANRSGQLFYVNHRFVRNRNLIHALDEAYRGILPQGRFPLLVAFIQVDPENVDVNVHPTKIEVKFVKEWEVHHLLTSAIRSALSTSAVSPTGFDSMPGVAPTVQRPPFAQQANHWQERPPVTSELDMGPFHDALTARIQATDSPFAPGPAPHPVDVASAVPDPFTDERELLAGAIVLAQARNMYIVGQSPSGILLIDQHVAHERVLYERLSSAKAVTDVQRLIAPVTLSLGKREALVVENKIQDIQSLGFDIEPFGKDAFVVRGVPAIIANRNYERILMDTIDELTELTLARRLMIHKDGIITTTACKMAIKAGERMSMDEMVRLVSDLKATKNPYLCPHGRPIVICISNRELDKMFGRA